MENKMPEEEKSDAYNKAKAKFLVNIRIIGL